MSLIARHVELYEFTRGTRVLRATGGDRDVVYAGQTFAAAAGLKRGRIAQAASMERTELGLDVPLSFPLLGWFRPFAPSERIGVRLLKVRKSDGVGRQLWRGVLSEIRESTHAANIRCQTRLATMGAAGLRRCWQVACPHVLYGLQCGVPQDLLRVDATLTAATTYTIDAAVFGAQADGWYDGGFIRWQVDGGVEHRFVVRHVGTTLHLLTPCALATGVAVAAFPGCNHTLTVCDEKFNNALNNGGQHTLPKTHPFDGNAVF